ADAEQIPFRDASFDFVWSWGVIHHSSSFETCLAEISRVLRHGGKMLLMVYYRDSLVYWLHCGLIRGLVLGDLRRKSLDQIYVDSTDGFYARLFRKAELQSLLTREFEQITYSVVGLKPELYPIPRSRVKRLLEAWTPNWFANGLLSRW